VEEQRGIENWNGVGEIMARKGLGNTEGSLKRRHLGSKKEVKSILQRKRVIKKK